MGFRGLVRGSDPESDGHIVLQHCNIVLQHYGQGLEPRTGVKGKRPRAYTIRGTPSHQVGVSGGRFSQCRRPGSGGGDLSPAFAPLGLSLKGSNPFLCPPSFIHPCPPFTGTDTAPSPWCSTSVAGRVSGPYGSLVCGATHPQRGIFVAVPRRVHGAGAGAAST